MLYWLPGLAGTELLDAARDAAAAGADAPPLSRSAKKRKAAASADGSADSAAAVPAAPEEEEARAALTGHTQCVATVAWPSAGAVYSGSWDHSVRAGPPPG